MTNVINVVGHIFYRIPLDKSGHKYLSQYRLFLPRPIDLPKLLWYNYARPQVRPVFYRLTFLKNIQGQTHYTPESPVL